MAVLVLEWQEQRCSHRVSRLSCRHYRGDRYLHESQAVGNEHGTWQCRHLQVDVRRMEDLSDEEQDLINGMRGKGATLVCMSTLSEEGIAQAIS